LLSKLKNERAIGLLGWLFCLELCRCCSYTVEEALTTLLGLITRRAVELVGTQSGVLYLWDEATQVLIPQAWHGHERELYNMISPSTWHHGPRFYPTYRRILRCVKLFIYQEKHL
jgi:hypothetical protein